MLRVFIGYAKMDEMMIGRKVPIRYPRLDTLLMVERYIRDHDGEFKKKQLWEHLPKKMMYQTFCVIIEYLLYSNKISIDAEGKIGWIYYPEETRELLKRKHLMV